MRSILNFVQALGNTSIEVHEWSNTAVRGGNLSPNSKFNQLTTKHPDLTFSGCNLAHAIVKADFLDRRNLTMPGLGFLIYASTLIDFSKSPLELKAGASKALNDFSLSSLSGRVGQGLSLLYSHRLGLKFSAHLSSYVANLPAGSPGAAYKGKPMADFLLAGNNNTVLMESKGSFTLQKNSPPKIKSVLKNALIKQVDPWMRCLQPTPTNGYVVYSCLREKSWAPSAMSVVDPYGEDDISANLPFSREEVMRENYGTWLLAMGFSQAAMRLTRRHYAPTADGLGTDFLVFEYKGRSYATPANPAIYSGSLPTLGIDLTILNAISTAIENPNLALAELLPNLPSQSDAQENFVSIFPDGSIFGWPDIKHFRLQTVRL